ncbi:hypothetical protein [Hungatella effluvii]|uniref:hypothetical protein n=1 Tax=Hungatella effluvii TaxID=1096246 RepID=UPI0022E0C13A|nr:hypothetical protein [Hungatella effluvii]
MLEIMTFLPPALLEGIPFEELDIDEFLGWLAKARYIQEIQSRITQQGIANAFPETDG